MNQNPEGTPRNSERPPAPEPRPPQEAGDSLVDAVREVFRTMRADQAQTAEDYMRKPPEDIRADRDRTPEQQNRQQEQKNRLDNLKQTLSGTGEPLSRLIPQRVVESAKQISAELAAHPQAINFNARFFERLSTLNIPEEGALPFARFVARSAERAITTGDPLSEGRNKTALALEVFLGETTDRATYQPMAERVIRAVMETHNQGGGYANYLRSEEFKTLAARYGINEPEYIEMMRRLETAERRETPPSERRTAKDKKEDILNDIADKDERARMDLLLLSLSPDQVLKLLRTINQDEADAAYTGNLREGAIYDYLEGDLARRYMEGTDEFRSINSWIDQYQSQYGLDPEMRGRVLEYFINFRNEIYVSKVKRFPRSPYFAEDPFLTWLNQFQEEIIAADLMLAMQNTFYFTEYFKGKIAETIRRHDAPPEDTDAMNLDTGANAKLREFMEASERGERYIVDGHTIYHDLLRDIRLAYLNQITARENPRFARAAQEIESAILSMKQTPEAKEATSFGKTKKEGKQLGGVEIYYKYSGRRERNELTGTFTEADWHYDTSLAHVTGVFVPMMREFYESYANFRGFVEVAEGSGDAKELVTKAKGITNALIDVAVEQSPIITTAMQSYIRIVRSILAANNNQIPPDLFARGAYVKRPIDKLLELEVKNAFPEMTDPERDVYLTIGKALAITSGEFVSMMANALPPMTGTFKDMPPDIMTKVINGENLRVEEIKQIEVALESEFKDFPFRGLLIAMNPVKYLHSWVKHNLYHVFNLGFVPMKPGEAAMDAVDAWDVTQKVMFSTFFGLDEDAVQYFDGKHHMPFFEISRMNQNISLYKRGGVRRRVMQLLEEDYIKSPTREKGYQVLDGEKTFRKLMYKSPMLAYYFMIDPDSHSTIRVRWSEPKDKNPSLPNDERKGGEISLKEKLIGELLDHMHKYFPTFFMEIEQPHFFRRRELTFNQGLQEKILDGLRSNGDRNSGYWKFLTEDEKSESIVTEQSDPFALGDKYMLENMVAPKRVLQRMTNIFHEAQTWLQVNQHRQAGDGDRYSLETFFTSANPREQNPDLYKAIQKAIGNTAGLKGLMKKPGPETTAELTEIFIRFAREGFYGGDSVYHNRTFLGNSKLPGHISEQIKKGKRLDDFRGSDRAAIDRHRKKIRDYYMGFINANCLENPFDWAYFDKTDLWFQGTGTNMIGRNVGDFNAILTYSSKWFDFINGVQDAISQPEKSFDIIKGTTDKIEGAVKEISTAYSNQLASRAGWVASAYLAYPFVPDRARDIPLAGKLPLFHTWATLVNADDIRRLNAWDSVKRKQYLDHLIHKEWSKQILTPMQENKALTDIASEVSILGIKTKNPLLRSLFGRRFKEHMPPSEAFTVDNFRKWTKTEGWWVGERKNFGIGYNVLLTVFMVGFLMLLFQAIKEGAKSAEIK